MPTPLQRVIELENQNKQLKEWREQEGKEAQRKIEWISKIGREKVELQSNIRKLEKLISILETKVETQASELGRYNGYKDADNKLIKELKDENDSQRMKILELEQTVTELKDDNEEQKKRTQELEQTIRNVSTTVPPTPPMTPGPSDKDAECQECIRRAEAKKRQVRKRKEFVPTEDQKLQGIKIVRLRMRADQRWMFEASFGESTRTKEYHVDDIALHFRETVAEWLEMKKTYRKGQQVQNIYEHRIGSLLNILNNRGISDDKGEDSDEGETSDNDIHMVER